ncbi:hypothetical protein P7C73_g4753, partial [Tremellales sp. Uapishka_1]
MAETETAIQTDQVADAIIAEATEPGPEASTSAQSQEQEVKVETANGNGNGNVDGDGNGDGDVEMKETTETTETEAKDEKDEKATEEKAAVVTEEDKNKLPDNACETLYLQNLNEKVRLPVMKETLASLFKPYKVVTPVTAHRNVRMRGQAFVTFADVENANRARKEVNEFPLYGKPIQLSFARTRSDVAVKRIEGDERLDEFKKERLEQKNETGAPQQKRQKIQMPDEYLPPNKVLFIQNLPEGTTSDDLRDVFEVHAGLLEIRTIPAKKDIAFVEFVDEAAATLAKDALHNFKIDGETKMKVTYARK